MFRALSLLLLSTALFAGVYDPKASAKNDIQNAVEKAKLEGKHVLLQVGGNWCPWCLKLEGVFSKNKEINQILTDHYVYVLVNTSKENKNNDVLASLDYPQRFGFPVLVILDAAGKRIHTQNTVYLEEGKGYNIKRVADFLKAWSPAALDPEKYK
ncbi:MAG: thioredoxin family protein [Acidobacteria bacterium]|nr:MAG: thioredoxin family protein [Acidobacteriota bacterium]